MIIAGDYQRSVVEDVQRIDTEGAASNATIELDLRTIVAAVSSRGTDGEREGTIAVHREWRIRQRAIVARDEQG